MKVMLIDIDGTICEDIKNEDSHLYPYAKIIEGALDQINKWYNEGHVITFFTAREEKDREVTIEWLNKHGFKYHSLIMNKPRCPENSNYVWIDNRKIQGITYKGKWGPLIEEHKLIQTMGN